MTHSRREFADVLARQEEHAQLVAKNTKLLLKIFDETPEAFESIVDALVSKHLESQEVNLPDDPSTPIGTESEDRPTSGPSDYSKLQIAEACFCLLKEHSTPMKAKELSSEAHSRGFKSNTHSAYRSQQSFYLTMNRRDDIFEKVGERGDYKFQLRKEVMDLHLAELPGRRCSTSQQTKFGNASFMKIKRCLLDNEDRNGMTYDMIQFATGLSASAVKNLVTSRDFDYRGGEKKGSKRYWILKPEDREMLLAEATKEASP